MIEHDYRHPIRSLQAKIGWCVVQACTKDWPNEWALDFVQANGAKEKGQGKGKRFKIKIMRDNGIMAFLWRIFALGNQKNKYIIIIYLNLKIIFNYIYIVDYHW